ncbi:MAG: putative glycoside hydrolase, partial [Oscillospiraceae bacterium]
GLLHYKSVAELAVQFNAISPDAIELAPLLEKIKSAGLSPIAQIYTLMDKTAPRTDRENTYGFENTTNINWYDNNPENGGKPWLNPYMTNTQTYLSSLVSEISSAGFKQINLKGLHFPDKNTINMNPINATVSKSEILTQLIQKLKESANGVPVFNVVNVAAYAGINAEGYFGELVNIKCDNTALFIDIANIEQNKAKICEQLAIPAEMPLNDVVQKLLEKARQNDNTSIISSNFTGLSEIMTAVNIKASTIY